MSLLSDIPAVAEMAAQGARFVLWYGTERNGKPTKIPIQGTGRNALSTEPATWCPLEEAQAAAARLRARGRRVDGIGFVLDAGRDGIVGVDLDGCRDPATGELRPWARDIIRDLASYAEVSPSGTGVKVYVRADPIPALDTHKLVVAKAAGGGKDEAIELYATGRYFCVTGSHLDDTPDEIADATEALERLAARVAREAAKTRHAGATRGGNGGAGPADGADPSAQTLRRLAGEPELARLWRGGKDRGDTSASGMDWSLARSLGRAGVAAEEIARALRAYPHGQIGAGKLAGRAASRRLAQLLDAAREAAEGKGEDERVEIRLADERRNAVMAECAGLLQEVVYLRDTMPTMLARAADVGGELVEDRDGAAVDLNGVRHRPGAFLFVEALPARVAWHLNERALFRRYVRREDEWVPTHCPKDLAADIVDTAMFLDFRACAGIVHVPLLVGGELVTKPGFHAPTGLILDLRGQQLNVPATPTRKAAETALERLLRPFRGYLDNKVVDRTALAAAALTAVLRPSLPTCPGVAIDGNNPGVGKGKLARVLSALNAGGVPAIVTEGHSLEETEKRLATAVIQGAPAILLDNLQKPLASSTLESMLTEPVADIRTFGRLGSLRVRCRSLVLMTANNATLRRDMLRRTLPLRVVVPDEKPELRAFDFDPVAEATADRTELLAAAFTVAVAWLRVRGLPENKGFRRPLGSFEEWADLVAGAVAWLTGKNPIDLIEERGEQDPGAADERCIIEALAKRYGTAEWTAREAAKDLERELWAAVVKLKGEQPDAGAVGKWLRSRKDRVFGELILTNEVDRKGIAKWQVCETPGMPGFAGDIPTSNARDGSVNEAKSHKTGCNIPGEPRHPRHPVPGKPEWAAPDEVEL